MSTNEVLFVGDSKNLPLCVVEHLTCWGVPIRDSYALAEALQLMKRVRFRMILTKLRLTDGSAIELIPVTAGQPVDLFSYLRLREGALWLPLVISGQECTSVRPLQTAGFLRLAEKRLKSAATTKVVEAESVAFAQRSALEVPLEHEP